MRILKDIYPGQVIITDPNYPHGKARNESAPAARDGFPLEEKWVNDVNGFFQALVSAASITPDGNPEQVGASQLLAAIQYIATHTTFTDGATFDDAITVNSGISILQAANFAGFVELNSGATLTGNFTVLGSLKLNAVPTLNPAVSVTRVQPLIAMQGDVAGPSEIPGDWYFNLGWVQKTGNSDLYFPITNVPDGSTLKSVRIMIDGDHTNLGGFSDLPGSMPTLKVEYIDASGTVQAPTPTATDSSGTVGDFNDSHTITCTLDTPIAIDNASAPKAIYARFDGAGGANFVANRLGIQRLDATFDCDQVNP